MLDVYYALAEQEYGSAVSRIFNVARIVAVFECSIEEVDKLFIEHVRPMQEQGRYIQTHIFIREPKNPLHELATREKGGYMQHAIQITQLKVSLRCKCPRCKKTIWWTEGSNRRVKCTCGTVLSGHVSVTPDIVAFEPWKCWYCGEDIPVGVSHDTSKCTQVTRENDA